MHIYTYGMLIGWPPYPLRYTEATLSYWSMVFPTCVTVVLLALYPMEVVPAILPARWVANRNSSDSLVANRNPTQEFR